MEKNRKIALGTTLVFFAIALGSCEKSLQNPKTSYEKILFAFSNALKALEKPSLKETSSAKGIKKARAYEDILADVKALAVETDRSLENSFDLDAIKYANSLVSGIGSSFIEGEIYSGTESGTLSFNFESFSTNDPKDYAYTLTSRLSAELTEEGNVRAIVGFTIALPEGHTLYSYASIDLSSAFDAASNDFSMDLRHYEDFFDVPTGTGFCSYEEQKTEVEDGLVSTYDDFNYQADERIVLDAGHPNWETYFADGVKFLPGTKIFDGEKVYKSAEKRDEDDHVSWVYHKNALMPIFVDELGLNSTGLNDEGYFSKNTTASSAAKKTMADMENTAGKSFAYILLGNLENIGVNLQATNVDSLPEEKTAVTSLKILDASSRKEIASGYFRTSDFLISDLLSGKVASSDETFKQSFTLCLLANYADGTSQEISGKDLEELTYQRSGKDATAKDAFFPSEGWDRSSTFKSVLSIYSSDNNASVDFQGFYIPEDAAT